MLIPGLVLVGCLAYPTDALGAEPSVVHLGVGDVAPFDGDLFTVERSIRMGLRVEGCEEQTRLNLTRTTRIFEAELRYERQAAAARLDAQLARTEIVKLELDEALAWYRSPVVVATVAVVATLAAATVVGYTWTQLARQ